MSKITLSLLVVVLVAVSCSAEAPRFRKANFNNRKFRFFQRQEEPAAAPYPPAGVTPATPLELPTETKPDQEYGPPSQEYGPPAAISPSQEYGPPIAEDPIVLVEEGSDDKVVAEEQEVVLAGEPLSERVIVYRVPSARLLRRPVARFIQREHK